MKRGGFMNNSAIKSEYKAKLSKRYRHKAFSFEELRNAEKMLRHIEQFSSPQKEFELVKYILAHRAPSIAQAA